MSKAKEKINKSEWIRSQPADLSAAQVVEKAKGKGIKLSPAFVYTVRSQANKPKAKEIRKPGRPRKNAVTLGGSAATGTLEQQFATMAIDIGLTKADELIAGLRQTAIAAVAH